MSSDPAGPSYTLYWCHAGRCVEQSHCHRSLTPTTTHKQPGYSRSQVTLESSGELQLCYKFSPLAVGAGLGEHPARVLEPPRVCATK